jgi:hypothetical protein
MKFETSHYKNNVLYTYICTRQDWKNVYTVYQIIATFRYNSTILLFPVGYWYSTSNISGNLNISVALKLSTAEPSNVLYL